MVKFVLASFFLFVALSQCEPLPKYRTHEMKNIEKQLMNLVEETSDFINEAMKRNLGDDVVDPSLSRLMKRKGPMQKRPEFMGNAAGRTYGPPPQGVRLSLARLMRSSGGLKTQETEKAPVSVPQYVRLINLQNATIEMDRYMKRLALKFSPKVLMSDPSWRELVLIYRSLEKLLPEEVRNENKEIVWWN